VGPQSRCERHGEEKILATTGSILQKFSWPDDNVENKNYRGRKSKAKPNVGKFLSIRATGGFSRRTHLHGVSWLGKKALT
jgi:hypothetical protein